MAIDVNAANNQANQLNNNVQKLRDAKKQMQAYKSSISNNWQGKEVTYIVAAIDGVIKDIESAIRNLDSLSTDIKNTAAQIRREEEAAARAAAERERRIREAQRAYDDACNELNNLMAARDNLLRQLWSSPLRSQAGILNQIRAIEDTIRGVQGKVQGAENALRAARR